MAYREFWISVRTAARSIDPRVVADSPRLDRETLERELRGATLWLTRSSVAGFDPNDFSFLGAEKQGDLARLVQEFDAMASTVNPSLPAPSDRVLAALPLFRDIVLMLEFDRYADPDALRIGKLIESEIASFRPGELEELRFNTGRDHSGDPALWIWAFLSSTVSDTDEHFLQAAQGLKKLLDPVARRVAPDRWPYISVRSMAEQSEPVEA